MRFDVAFAKRGNAKDLQIVEIKNSASDAPCASVGIDVAIGVSVGVRTCRRDSGTRLNILSPI